MSRHDRPLPAVFIQYGVYHSRKKRGSTRFTVLYRVTDAEIQREANALIRKLQRRALSRGGEAGEGE